MDVPWENMLKIFMKKEIIPVNNQEFVIILHAMSDSSYPEGSRFQWYITDDPNGDNATPVDGQMYESITLSSDTIKNKYENKWLYCKCELPDNTYDEGCIYLTDDFVEMIRENQFDKINFFTDDGMSWTGNGYVHEKTLSFRINE